MILLLELDPGKCDIIDSSTSEDTLTNHARFISEQEYLFPYKTSILCVYFLKTTEDRVAQRKTRIFLVDDETDILMLYKTGLERNGFLVDVFNDPVQALSSFKAGEYDLLLLDIKMPRMNGFELYREIKKLDDKVRVCYITAFVTYYESLREIFDIRNIHCIIKKPIEMTKLIRRITDELVREPTRHMMPPS